MKFSGSGSQPIYNYAQPTALMTRISIIGAGPSGSYAGWQLAKAGYDVDIYEEHNVIGKPVACTGILTKALFEFVNYDKEYMINELSSVEVIAPSGETTRIPLHEYVICRATFDQYLANKAQDAGANIHLSHRYKGKENGEIILRHDNEFVRKKTDILIGADGPASIVAKSAGIFGTRKFYAGHQAILTGSFDKETFTTWFGSAAAPGFFAWSVPENESVSRVGVAVKGNPHEFFARLKQKIGGEIKEVQAGAIPVHDPNGVVEKNNVFLVGDAAGLVKNTTGGGIITGMWSSKILAESILTGTNYTKNLKPLKRELWIHQKLRNALNKFSDDDYNRLVRWMNNQKVKKILCEHPREYPSRFMLKLLAAEPRFLGFATKAF